MKKYNDAHDGGDYSYSAGIATNQYQDQKDDYTALTPLESKDFKTYNGAARWLKSRGYNADGTRIPSKERVDFRKEMKR